MVVTVGNSNDADAIEYRFPHAPNNSASKILIKPNINIERSEIGYIKIYDRSDCCTERLAAHENGSKLILKFSLGEEVSANIVSYTDNESSSIYTYKLIKNVDRKINTSEDCFKICTKTIFT